MAKLFADKKSYYADIQDFTQGRKSYFKLLAHYDAKTRFELYRKAGLDEHTITQYEYGVRAVDQDAYDRDAEKAYGAETANKMRADLAKLPHPNHDPTKLTINWRSANKEEKTVNLPLQAENKNSEETKNIQEVKNNFVTLTPSATGEKNTMAAEEEEKVNQRFLSENTETVKKLAHTYITPNSQIHADENAAYDELIVNYMLYRVNHQKEYRSDDGITNNLAESYFARFKRMYYGQVHRMSNLYLDNYANEVAYREDTRRIDNLTIFNDVISKCLSTSSDNDWTGYWQGHHRQVERLVM